MRQAVRYGASRRIGRLTSTHAGGADMSTEDIKNYIKVSDLLMTGGQPGEQQLRDAAAEGVAVVVNLATINPRYSLSDEEGLVRSLGMEYYHIPVAWDDPKTSDFAAFETLMSTLGARKTLLHCAANYRVTAFYALYAMKRLGWSEAEADDFMAQVWRGSDYPIWQRFIADMKAAILHERQAATEAAALDAFFAGYDRSRALFETVRSAINSLGPVDMRVGKSQIAFRLGRRRAFAWVWIPGRYLRRTSAPLVLTVALRRRDASARWKEVVEPAPGRFTHHLELHTAADIDDAVRAWLQEARGQTAT